MEVPNDALIEIILKLDLESIFDMLKSDKQIHTLVFKLLPQIINGNLEGYYMYEEFIRDLLEINAVMLAQKALLLVRNYEEDIDNKVSYEVISHPTLFKNLLKIIPPDFQWDGFLYALDDNITAYGDIEPYIIIFKTAIEERLYDIIQVFIDFWEVNDVNNEDLRPIMDPLIEKANKLFRPKTHY
jgi:hypothetical protein